MDQSLALLFERRSRHPLKTRKPLIRFLTNARNLSVFSLILAPQSRVDDRQNFPTAPNELIRRPPLVSVAFPFFLWTPAHLTGFALVLFTDLLLFLLLRFGLLLWLCLCFLLLKFLFVRHFILAQ